jgi:hypothetical protein
MLCWRARPSLLSWRRCGLRLSKRWDGRRMSALRRLSQLTSSSRPCWETPSGGEPAHQADDGVVQQYFAAQMLRWRSAVPVAAAALDGAASNLADVACQACNKRSSVATMLLCDRCNQGYYTRCLVPALPAVPDDDWVCPSCALAPALPAPSRPACPCPFPPPAPGHGLVGIVVR